MSIDLNRICERFDSSHFSVVIVCEFCNGYFYFSMYECHNTGLWSLFKAEFHGDDFTKEITFKIVVILFLRVLKRHTKQFSIEVYATVQIYTAFFTTEMNDADYRLKKIASVFFFGVSKTG